MSSVKCCCVSVGSAGAMVTLNQLSVEDPDDCSPLLPEAAEAAVTTPVTHRQQVVTKTDSRGFVLCRYSSTGICIMCLLLKSYLCDLFSLLYRRVNLAFSVVLLIGCYSAILIPAYFPFNKSSALSDDYEHPKDLVEIHISGFLNH